MKHQVFRTLYFACMLLGLSAGNRTFAQEHYFYTGKDYGSEALFNPLTLFINGGYDICQLQSVSNKITGQMYGKMIHNVLGNLGDPFPRIRRYGTHEFLIELVPTGMSKETAPWIPNYTLHVIGCGMLSTAMREWYEAHDVPAPWAFSAVTLMAMHFWNEVMETGPYEGYSVDEISDIYIFDIGGIILFSFDNVNDFFHRKLNLSDWSLQASISLPHGRVNAGQFFSIKWELPFWNEHYFFYRFGMGALWGLSEKINPEDCISAGVGFRTKHLVDLDITLRDRTIETSWQAGIFYDRNNSLLGSLVLSGVKEYFISADVYPGVLKIGKLSPGLWTIIGRNGDLTMGVTTRYLIGTGFDNH